MRWVLVLASLWLAGCSTLIPYTHNDSLSPVEATALVERALISQPRKLAAERVEVTDEFVAYGLGVVTTEQGGAVALPLGNGAVIASGRSSAVSKATQNRIYFDSLTRAELYSRKGKFVVIVSTNDGRPPQHFMLYSEQAAQRLIDGLFSLKRRWEERRGR